MRSVRFRRSAAPLVLCAALASVRCSDSSGSAPSVADYITGISVVGNPALTAVLAPDSLPVQGIGLFVHGGSTVITGGSSPFSLVAASPFQYIGVVIPGRNGHYFLALPAPTDSVDLALTLAGTIAESQFDLGFLVASDSGLVGDGLHTVLVQQVNTGPVQVSVSWDVDSDVDLHLVIPGGEEIYYAHTKSPTGGELDLDSNGGCAIDGVRNENIGWPQGTPPAGTYTVRADYWSNCTVAQTNYIVTVRVQGHMVQTFTGTFTGTGDAGGAGSGATVATFTFP